MFLLHLLLGVVVGFVLGAMYPNLPRDLMEYSKRQKIIPVLILAITLLPATSAWGRGVIDEAGLFSDAAKQEATKTIDVIAEKSGEQLSIYVFRGLPTNVQFKNNDEKAHYYEEWASRLVGTSTILVLITQDPRYIRIFTTPRSHLPVPERERMSQVMVDNFKAQRLDSGLLNGVAVVQSAVVGGHKYMFIWILAIGSLIFVFLYLWMSKEESLPSGPVNDDDKGYPPGVQRSPYTEAPGEKYIYTAPTVRTNTTESAVIGGGLGLAAGILVGEALAEKNKRETEERPSHPDSSVAKPSDSGQSSTDSSSSGGSYDSSSSGGSYSNESSGGSYDNGSSGGDYSNDSSGSSYDSGSSGGDYGGSGDSSSGGSW